MSVVGGCTSGIAHRDEIDVIGPNPDTRLTPLGLSSKLTLFHTGLIELGGRSESDPLGAKPSSIDNISLPKFTRLGRVGDDFLSAVSNIINAGDGGWNSIRE